MRIQFHLKHLLWLVVISAAVLALTRNDPAALLGTSVMVVTYVAFLVAGRAMEVLDGIWETGWAGLFRKREQGQRALGWVTILLGVVVAICFWVVAVFLATAVHRLFSH